MKCYYHPAADAVAVCKNCSRGVCPGCAAEVGNGIACKGKCEAEVEAVNQIINRNKTSFQKAGAAFSRNAVIYLMLGVLFAALGVTELSARAVLGWFLLLTGAVFLVGAILNYSTSQKYTRG